MSALIYVISEERISIYTDTLVVNEYGEEISHASKALPLPHLNAVICGFGLAGLSDQLFHQANTRSLKDIADLSSIAEEFLPLFYEGLDLSTMPAHITSTVYIFGFDQNENKPLAFAHRSENSFKSENISLRIPVAGAKPTEGITQEDLIFNDESDVLRLIFKQRLAQEIGPEDERIYIGGSLYKIQIVADGMTVQKLIDIDEVMRLTEE